MQYVFFRIAFLTGLCVTRSAWAGCAEANIESAYEREDIPALQRIIDDGLAKPTLDSTKAALLGLAAYREATLLARKSRKDDAETLLDHTIAKIEPVRAKGRDKDLTGVVSMLYGLEIGLSPFRGFYLGDRIRDMMEGAEKDGKATPRLHLAEGLSRLYRPKIFGGGPANAVPELNSAIAGFDQGASSNSGVCWGRADAMLGLARAKIALNERPVAIKLINDVIAQEAQNPMAHWMLDELKTGQSAGK
jgi:hypothetical protein